jgi:hypothetical protein
MLEYNKYSFSLAFEKKVAFRSLPSFIFRNNIGFQLRKITCVLKNQECQNCILRVSCIYSSVFETPIEKNNAVLGGRNKAPHPYAVYADAAVAGTAVDGLNLDIVLIGTGVKYFPYMLLAMFNMSKSGILKERIKFNIDDIICGGVSIMDKSDYSCKNVKPEIWNINKDDIDCQLDVYNNSLNSSGENGIKTVRINFLTPVRLQHKGRYLSNITYKDLLYAAVRRVGLLNDFFGDGDIDAAGGDFVDSATEGKEFDADLKWVDYSRYSARQKQSMKMGGLVGTATVKGRFSEAELSLLNAAELFGIGKNVSFGLGRIGVEVTED